MNLFLGYYVPSRHTVPLWEMENDYYLHNFHVRTGRGSYKSMMLYQRTFGIDWSDEEDDDIVRGDGDGTGGTAEESGSGLVPGAPPDDGDKESWRIKRVRKRCSAQNEALSSWWKAAVQSYVQQRMWMTLGRGPDPECLLPPRFERLYQPEKLAQFDKFFARSWATPVRLTHQAQHSHSVEDDTELMLFHRKNTSPARPGNLHPRGDEAGISENDLGVAPEHDAAEKHDEMEKDIREFVASYGFASKKLPALTHFISSHKSYHRSLRRGRQESIDESRKGQGRSTPKKPGMCKRF